MAKEKGKVQDGKQEVMKRGNGIGKEIEVEDKTKGKRGTRKREMERE